MANSFLKFLVITFFVLLSFAHSAVIKKIEIQGLEIISLGTALNYLPAEVGDEYNLELSQQIIQQLYRTNFFKSIRLEENEGNLLIVVEENPQIKTLTITGNEIISSEDLEKFAQALELTPGSIFSDYKLAQWLRELENAYLEQGYYASNIRNETTFDDNNNSIDIVISINEGEVAKISKIQVIGAHSYSEESVLKLIPVGESNLFTYFTENNRYSKAALNSGLEKIRSFYNGNGFADFEVADTNVSISANKKDVEIVVKIVEGKQYTIGNIILNELEEITQAQFQAALTIKTGDLFDQKEIVKTVNAIKKIVANQGYFNANINALTNKQENGNGIDILFEVTPNERIYVNRINLVGNTRTQDEVIRREIRQLEGSFYSAESIEKSLSKLRSLGYFSDVQYSTAPVANSTDQIDVTIKVVETKTGNFSIGLSQSSSSGTSINLGISERNFLGSGNTLNAEVSQSDAVQQYNLFFTDPFFTDDNHSISYGVFYKKLDADELSVSDYQIDSYGFNFGYGIPLSDETRVNMSIRSTQYEVTCGATFSLEESQCQGEEKNKESDVVAGLSWQRSTLNAFYFPTDGNSTELSTNVAIPGGNYRYYTVKTTHNNYIPLNIATTFKTNANVSYSKGYDDKDLPFFKRYYAGGNNTVRGFKFNSLGEDYVLSNRSKGGELLTTMGVSLITPVPLVEDSKNMRVSLFLDMGNVYQEASDFKASDLRSSAGFAFSWITPIGPLGFYLATPLSKKDGDETRRFEFSLGTTF